MRTGLQRYCRLSGPWATSKAAGAIRGDRDLFVLADRFEEYEFPVDGLWLDIDYMDDSRVFTFDDRYLPDPAKTVATLLKRGFRVVPILDPGIKRDENYPVYIDGKVQNIFCLTEAGVPFVGMVWAGFTVFPDFSLPEARQWWARLAGKFFDIGFERTAFDRLGEVRISFSVFPQPHHAGLPPSGTLGLFSRDLENFPPLCPSALSPDALSLQTIDRFAAVLMEETSGTHYLHPEELPVQLSGNSLKWYRWVLSGSPSVNKCRKHVLAPFKRLFYILV
jgi:hypothetical protein